MSADVAAQLGMAFINSFNERSDADIYTDDAVLWNNITEVEHPHGSGVGQALQDALPDLRFDDAVVHAWDDGFVVQYTVRATLPDGTQLRAPACGIGVVNGGRIARFQEYVDSGQVAGLNPIVEQAVDRAG